MTVKEIAVAVGKTERSVQNWLTKILRQADENPSPTIKSIAGKYKSSGHGKSADYTQDETIAIIREGMGEVPAGVYQSAAQTQSTKPAALSYRELQQIRLAVKAGILATHEARRMMGLSPVAPDTELSPKIAKQVYAVAAKAAAKQQSHIEDMRNNPELDL